MLCAAEWLMCQRERCAAATCKGMAYDADYSDHLPGLPRPIDRADGIEDGNLYKVEHFQCAQSENALVRGLMHYARTAPPTGSPPSRGR